MLRAIRYELNPTDTQKALIKQACGCCRKVYNVMLDRKISAYKEVGKNLSAFDLMKRLQQLKTELPYLKDAPSQALQQAIRNLDTAYANFFRKGGSGFPKFKKKGCKDSFRIPVACAIDYDNWTIKTAKIGIVKFYKGHNKRIEGRIKSYTITHTNTDRYFISVLYETVDKPKLNNGKSVGIDVGIKTFATLSDGKVFESQKHLKSSLRKLRVLQRTASRRYQKGKKKEEQSNNWKKAVRQVAKLQEKVAFQRLDFLHKASKYIVNDLQSKDIRTLIIGKNTEWKSRCDIGKANNQNFIQIPHSRFIGMLTYKCEKVGIKVKLQEESYTSKCSFLDLEEITKHENYCGKRVKRGLFVSKDKRKINADVNASYNIMRKAIPSIFTNHGIEGFVVNPTVVQL